ncbi:T cell activation RhoGTPase activating protein b isoform X2 [Phyllopteryx taeniolatus]|uniref:T cell activation RhoGTPase activating protein b isoform X2 n=1 Tax=Phyllopteryx taeniolatus TaxID=161469 RepID=UPI002AD2ED0F|nr:T cell activation RhoGTPase activating protein b isoform X2 [Phyllopteryx taeniolatus]
MRQETFEQMPLNYTSENRTNSLFASKLSAAADICVGLAILSVVFLSIMGNGMVLVICYRRRKKMVGTELLCVNLAVVDFLCCICFYPLSILSSFHHAWLGENVTCIYYGLGCYIFGLCGMFTIAAISIIRYLKTCYSLVYAVWLESGNIRMVCCVIWLVAAVWSSFPLFGWGEYVPEPYGLSCTVAWRGYHTSAKDAFYVICSFVCFTLLPVLLIVMSHCQILYKVSRFSYSLSARGIHNNLRHAEKRLSMKPHSTAGGSSPRDASMDSSYCGGIATRRGSYDEAGTSLRPHFRNMAQRRRSAPSLVLGKALGMPWSPIREETSCWVSVEHSPFVHGLTSENGELLLDECVHVTEGTKTRERHLFLFGDVIVFAKIKSTSSYRVEHRVKLEDVWLHAFQDEAEHDEGTAEDADLSVTLALAWGLTFCLVCFCSPEVKARWFDTLHSKIQEARARAGCASSCPDILMKVLGGITATKNLIGGGMELFVNFDGDVNTSAVSQLLNNQDEKLLQTLETKWSLVRKLKKGSSFISKATQSDAKTQLFGRPLCKVCPDDSSLPKPITEMLVLLRKRGPSTEGVFRKPCNNKNMRVVRDRLDGGLEVDMKAQPVALLVGLLKSFLKDLPGSLLVCELYKEWMTALQREESQQREQELRRVVNKLPGPNKLLLQYLACVLYHILENADHNKMDAYNLAVCIGPTLLQMEVTQLEEQKETMKKVTELTQFLIEHCEILGENIPHLLDTDEDSVSSQHHDSAYDSTDPDGDGDAGGSGSSPSLSLSVTISTCSSDAIFNSKPAFNRRCSEPIILPSVDALNLCGHSRSHDDCSVENFAEQPLKKQISEDSFWQTGQRGNQRPGLSFSKLSSCSNIDRLSYTGNQVTGCSSSSLESAASNQSESSVFTSSPAGSPPCSRRTSHNIVDPPRPEEDSPVLISSETKRSNSLRAACKVLMRTRSLGAFSRNSLKKEHQNDNAFPCGTLQEDSQREALSPTEPKQRPLSAIEVFRLVDSRLPCRPPPYEQAVHNAPLVPRYGSMTVYDAVALERRSRPSSGNYSFPPSYFDNRRTDGCKREAQDESAEGNLISRQRAVSESVSAAGHREAVSRRCSQSAFEEFPYAKESYV